MIVLPLLWQVPKTFHQKFLFLALGHYHVDPDLSVLSGILKWISMGGIRRLKENYS